MQQNQQFKQYNQQIQALRDVHTALYSAPDTEETQNALDTIPELVLSLLDRIQVDWNLSIDDCSYLSNQLKDFAIDRHQIGSHMVLAYVQGYAHAYNHLRDELRKIITELLEHGLRPIDPEYNDVLDNLADIQNDPDVSSQSMQIMEEIRGHEFLSEADRLDDRMEEEEQTLGIRYP